MEKESINNEEKEIYEILASMPIDTERLNSLKDLTLEADLLMRSKFLKRLKMKFDDLLKIHELGKDKELLLTTQLDGKRYIIYIDHGKIVSSAETDPESGNRIAGLKPLATLLLVSKIKPLTFKLFEVYPRQEETTREAPKTAYKEYIQEKKTPRKVEKEEKPLVLKFAEALKQFLEKVKQDAEDITSLYGCRLVDVKMAISKGTIILVLKLRNRSIFSRCDPEKFRKHLESDIEVIAPMLDINLPIKIDVRLLK